MYANLKLSRFMFERYFAFFARQFGAKYISNAPLKSLFQRYVKKFLQVLQQNLLLPKHHQLSVNYDLWIIVYLGQPYPHNQGR